MMMMMKMKIVALGIAQNPCTTQDQRSGNKAEDFDRRFFSCLDLNIFFINAMDIYGLTNLMNFNKSYFKQRETRTGL